MNYLSPDHILCFPRLALKAATGLDQEIVELNLRDLISYMSRQRRGLQTLSLFTALGEAVSPHGQKMEILTPSGQRNFFPPSLRSQKREY